MKRYKLSITSEQNTSNRFEEKIAYYENPDGEWIKYEDIKQLIEEKRQLQIKNQKLIEENEKLKKELQTYKKGVETLNKNKINKLKEKLEYLTLWKDK